MKVGEKGGKKINREWKMGAGIGLLVRRINDYQNHIYDLIQAIIIFITLMLTKTLVSFFSNAKLKILKGKYLI